MDFRCAVCLTLQMWFQLWPATISKLAKHMSKLALDISTLLLIMYVKLSSAEEEVVAEII